MNGYEKRTNEKKRAIIDAARGLFSERGVARVSISEIAKSAQVSQVSIYNYFEDKNTLAKEAFISYIEEAISKFEGIIESNAPFLEKLGHIMRDKSGVAEAASSYFNEQAWEDKALQQIFQEALEEKATRLYIRFIDMAKSAGTINADIPTEAIMTYFTMSMAMLKQPDYYSRGSEYQKGMMELFLHGLLGR